MRRVAAVIGAVLMVVLAVAVRSRLSGDERGSSSSPARLACPTELRDLCTSLDEAFDDLEVDLAEVGTTQADLTDGSFDPETGDIDGWLTPESMAAMITEERSRTGAGTIFADFSAPLGRTPIVMVVWADRVSTLEEHCGGTINWSCVGDVADQAWTDVGGKQSWGDVRVGFASVDRADGLLSVAEATASYLGTTDYASNDFSDLDYLSWLGNLALSSSRSVAVGTTPLDDLLSKGPAALQVAAASEADAATLLAASARRDDARLIYPDPLVTEDLVLAPIKDAPGASRLGELLGSDEAAKLIAAAGWRVEGQEPADGIPADPALPDNNGLPAPGVLTALRSTWNEVD